MLPIKIAVIDDDPSFVALMQEMLSDEGYLPASCSTPKDAVPFIRAEAPDLVVLDLWMGSPTAGLEILSELRRIPTLADLPVIVCSANWELLRQRETELQAAGCALIRKPFDLQAMLKLVSGCIARARTRPRTSST